MSRPATASALLSIGAAGLVAAVGGVAAALLCDGVPHASEGLLRAVWSLVGPWLGTALSLVPGRDAQRPPSALPALALLGALCSLLLLPAIHHEVLAFTLIQYALVIVASVYRYYTLRLAFCLACGAGLAALHVFAELCKAG